MRISAIFISFVLLFSQHLIELLSFSLIETYEKYTASSTTSDNTANTNITDFTGYSGINIGNSRNDSNNSFKSANIFKNILPYNNSLVLPPIAFLAINLFFIGVKNTIVFYLIKFSNDITFSSGAKLKLPNKRMVIVIVALGIIGNLQALHYYDFIFSNILIGLLFLIFLCTQMLLKLIYS